MREGGRILSQKCFCAPYNLNGSYVLSNQLDINNHFVYQLTNPSNNLTSIFAFYGCNIFKNVDFVDIQRYAIVLTVKYFIYNFVKSFSTHMTLFYDPVCHLL